MPYTAQQKRDQRAAKALAENRPFKARCKSALSLKETVENNTANELEILKQENEQLKE